MRQPHAWLRQETSKRSDCTACRQPAIVEVQILRVGQLVVLCVPGELTTMAGRRLREAVHQQVQASPNLQTRSLPITAFTCKPGSGLRCQSAGRGWRSAVQGEPWSSQRESLLLIRCCPNVCSDWHALNSVAANSAPLARRTPCRGNIIMLWACLLAHLPGSIIAGDVICSGGGCLECNVTVAAGLHAEAPD